MLFRRVLDVVVGLALGATIVLGAAFTLEESAVRADATILPQTTSTSRLERPRTIDALPRWNDERARKEPPTGRPPTTRRFAVTFHHLHTRELLPAEADVLPSDEAMSRFFRCRVTFDTHTMEHAPIEVAVQMAREHGADRIEVISGFRSPKLNELLRKKGREVARDSRHVVGQALDFRIPGVPAPQLATEVQRVHVGGVGTYPVSQFVHVDVGPARQWRGR